MTLDMDDLARRSTVHHLVDHDVPQVQKLVAITASPRADDTRRLLVLQRALGDLAEALACGQNFDDELVMVGASVEEWLEDRAAALSRCVCPIMPGVGSEDRIALPECPAHGEGAA